MMNIGVQALAERMVMFAEQYPGQESSELIDLFLQQVHLMGVDDRDSRLAIIAPIFRDYFVKTRQTVKASALVGASERQYISYSQFGAVGDGVTDDFAAIIKTHAAANELGLPVKADPGATYYIGDSSQSAIIQTDTDWTGAKFIIDDREVDTNRQTWIFRVSRTLPAQWYGNQAFTLEPNQTNLGRALPHDSLVYLLNSNVLTFSNTSLCELLIVDKDGTIHEDTPVFNHFNQVTSMYVYPVDKVPLTIKGGHFTTINNLTPRLEDKWSEDLEYARGIRVERSNTIVDGVIHDITGEDQPGVLGNRYDGFISIHAAVNVTVQNVVVHGRKIAGYELTHSRAINVTYRNATQSTDIFDTTYWITSTGSWVRNLVYDNCVLSKAGVHRGVHNLTVRNSTISYFAGPGSGTLLVENTQMLNGQFGNESFFYCGGYPAPDKVGWNGEIIIKDCVFQPGAGSTGVIGEGGYTSLHVVVAGGHHYPKVKIDGLRILSEYMPSTRPRIILYYAPSIPNPVVPDEIYVRGITYSDNWRSGFAITTPADHPAFAKVNVIQEW